MADSITTKNAKNTARRSRNQMATKSTKRHSAAHGRNHILVEQEEAEKAEFLVNE
jgi:hypothetical protein